MQNNKIDNMRRIIQILPKQNCGECGFENCGEFAVAVAEGRASPFQCREDPSVGHKIEEILMVKMPQVSQPIRLKCNHCNQGRDRRFGHHGHHQHGSCGRHH